MKWCLLTSDITCCMELTAALALPHRPSMKKMYTLSGLLKT